jgi:hypothetical protein
VVVDVVPSLQSIGAPLVEAAGSAALCVAGAGGEEVPLDDPEAAAPPVDAAADLSTPPWWLQAPLPVLAEVVPSLQTTGAPVAEAAVSAAALPANGKANTPANKAPYTSAQELRIFMEIPPLVGSICYGCAERTPQPGLDYSADIGSPSGPYLS